MNVNGGSGKDTVQSEESYGLEDFSSFSFTANLEGGNDYYNGDFGENDIEEASEASYNLQGGDGNDRMTFEGGGDGTSGFATPAQSDEGSITVGGIFQVNMYGGTGNDTMDMWNDNAITPTFKPSAKPLATPSSSDPMAPMYFNTAEEGDVRVVMSGDAGNDKVRMNLGATEDSVGDYDLSVLGAAGKDTVAAGFDDETTDENFSQQAKPAALGLPTSSITFGPSGAILVDGGRDTDTYQIVGVEDDSTGSPILVTPFSIRSCEIESSSLLPILF
jgi:hypothetical protein